MEKEKQMCTDSDAQRHCVHYERGIFLQLASTVTQAWYNGNFYTTLVQNWQETEVKTDTLKLETFQASILCCLLQPRVSSLYLLLDCTSLRHDEYNRNIKNSGGHIKKKKKNYQRYVKHFYYWK